MVALTLGPVFHLAAQSTQMTVHLNDGTQRTFNMSESNRVYFEDGETLVVETPSYHKGTLSDRFNLADIRKITCTETVGTTENPDLALSIFPNPVHDVLTFRNLQGKQTISIYTLDGRRMKAMEVTGNQAIDISDLPIGLYLVKTERQTLKMIKL